MSAVDKGSRWRKLTEDWLRAQGFATKARPWMMPGDDITARLGDLELSVETKDHRALNLAQWVGQAERNAPDGAIPVVIAHRLGKSRPEDAYIVMSGAAFAELVRRR